MVRCKAKPAWATRLTTLSRCDLLSPPPPPEPEKKGILNMKNRAILFTFAAVLICAHVSAINILTSKYDNSRSGLNLTETSLTLQNVNSNTFGKLFERTANGDMYPQPLIAEGVTIGGGTHNVVYVATANNNVYAYDAEDRTV